MQADPSIGLIFMALVPTPLKPLLFIFIFGAVVV